MMQSVQQQTLVNENTSRYGGAEALKKDGDSLPRLLRVKRQAEKGKRKRERGSKSALLVQSRHKRLKVGTTGLTGTAGD